MRLLRSAHSKVHALQEALQKKVDSTSISDLEDELAAYEARWEGLKKDLSDAMFDLQKAQSRCDRLEAQLANALEELAQRPEVPAIPSGKTHYTLSLCVLYVHPDRYPKSLARLCICTSGPINCVMSRSSAYQSQ